MKSSKKNITKEQMSEEFEKISDDLEATLNRIRKKLIDKTEDLAIETLVDAMKDRFHDMPSAINAASKALKYAGLEKQDLNINQEKPFKIIIERYDSKPKEG